jgi:hypothetical protein
MPSSRRVGGCEVAGGQAIARSRDEGQPRVNGGAGGGVNERRVKYSRGRRRPSLTHVATAGTHAVCDMAVRRGCAGRCSEGAGNGEQPWIVARATTV